MTNCFLKACLYNRFNTVQATGLRFITQDRTSDVAVDNFLLVVTPHLGFPWPVKSRNYREIPGFSMFTNMLRYSAKSNHLAQRHVLINSMEYKCL